MKRSRSSKRSHESSEGEATVGAPTKAARLSLDHSQAAQSTRVALLDISNRKADGDHRAQKKEGDDDPGKPLDTEHSNGRVGAHPAVIGLSGAVLY